MIEEALYKAAVKCIEVLTSRKFHTLFLSTILLLKAFITPEIWLAVALAYMGITAYTKLQQGSQLPPEPPKSRRYPVRDRRDDPIP